MNMTESAKLGPQLPLNVIRPATYKRNAVFGLAAPIHKFIVDDDSGRVHLKQTDTVLDSHLVSTYTMEEGKPLSAVAVVEGYMNIEYPNIEEGIVTHIDISNKMWSDYK